MRSRTSPSESNTASIREHDPIVAKLDLAVDDRVQRGLLRERPQPVGDEELFPHLPPAVVPRLLRRRGVEREVVVERDRAIGDDGCQDTTGVAAVQD